MRKSIIGIAIIMLMLSGCDNDTTDPQDTAENAVVYEATAAITQSANTIVTWTIDKSRNIHPYGQLTVLSNNSYSAASKAVFDCGETGEPTCTDVQKIICEETGFTGTEYYFRCHLDDNTVDFIEFNVYDRDNFHLLTMLSGWVSKNDRDNGAYADNFDTSGIIDYN